MNQNNLRDTYRIKEGKQWKTQAQGNMRNTY